MKTTQFNPSRLSIARRRRGLTKRALAEIVSISERSLSAYEAGETVPLEATVTQISSALQFPVSFFTRCDVERIREKGASFRSMTRMTAARRDRALAGGELALELMHWLEKHFRLPDSDIPDLRPQGDAEAAARALRVRWALDDLQPIRNMVRLLEAKGVRVFSLAEDCLEVDAFSFWRGAQPFVFLNTIKSPERSRFDAAHELGHLVLHQHGTPIGREAEREADTFASAFLMPRSSILALIPRQIITLDKLIAAKRYWNVSVAALVYRLHDVGLVSDWHYRMLCIEIQKRGFRKSEPESAPREMSQVMEKIFAALKEEGINRPDLARILDWPVTELNSLIFGLSMVAMPGGLRSTSSTVPSVKEHLRLMN